ncbi:hypothetical protein CHELA1G11_13443 [Hyphomicrobiales bacterium]|nr:hypothetical protein CHELA1G2_10874 [Hyphomicrobiales bacterium]CAH1671705.1 hypothetical protein CHELA1G11_13443 [Hyphomicrobiales bacterium]
MDSRLNPARLTRDDTGGSSQRSSQVELHADMARDEAEALIETAGIGADGVAGELHEAAALGAAGANRISDELAAETLVAVAFGNPHTLDLATRRPPVAQAGNEGQLAAADDLPFVLHDDEPVVGILGDSREGREIAGGNDGVRQDLARLAELIVRQHLDYRPEVVDGRIADGCHWPPERKGITASSTASGASSATK